MTQRQIAMRTIILCAVGIAEAEATGDMRASFTLLGILTQAAQSLEKRKPITKE